MSSKPLVPGVYAPLPCFFKDDEEIDLESYKKHVVYLAKGGVRPVISGTMGEAPHLSHPERTSLIRAAREALDSAGLKDIPIIAGAGAVSTRESIQLAKEAAEAGADQVIVIPPGYFAGNLLANGKAALRKYFVDIAAASTLPVILYNFPGVTGGIDMDSDFILDIAKSAPNTCGIKLTCGGVGKITRVTGVTNSSAFLESRKHPFLIFDGFIDILLPSILGGDGAGTITGLANLAPNVCTRLYELAQGEQTVARLKEAQKLQALVSEADWAMMKGGIAGTKYILKSVFGYGPLPRGPLLPTTEEEGKALLATESIIEILALEKKLASERSK